jgi:hypothetical protein
MTSKPSIALTDLLEKGSDTDLMREMIHHIVERAHHKIFTRSPARPRNTNSWPGNGASSSCVWTRPAKPSKPLRMSVALAASRTFNPAGSAIIDSAATPECAPARRAVHRRADESACRPRRCNRRQANSRFAFSSCLRATAATETPGRLASARMLRVSSSVRRRRVVDSPAAASPRISYHARVPPDRTLTFNPRPGMPPVPSSDGTGPPGTTPTPCQSFPSPSA